MPVFTSTGLAWGAAALFGVAAYAAGGGFSKEKEQEGLDGVDERLKPTDTGQISEDEAQSIAKKRAFRKGIIFTSPTGLDQQPSTSSAKLR